MRTFTNPYSNEVVHMMTEAELKQYRRETIRKHKEFKKRKFRRLMTKAMKGLFEGLVVSVIFISFMIFCIMQIPPM